MRYTVTRPTWNMPMRFTSAACIVMLGVSLAACGDAKRTLGLEKSAPDEFTVVARPPLNMPPDFGLKPPKQGAARPQEVSAQDQAKRAILGPNAQKTIELRRELPAGISSGETALLKQAGATNSPPNIRTLVDKESTVLAKEEQSFTDKLVFWRGPRPPGQVVDAEKETQRLRSNAGLGMPVTEGETPVIKRKRRGMLEGIF